jgi:hypothetical protein
VSAAALTPAALDRGNIPNPELPAYVSLPTQPYPGFRALVQLILSVMLAHGGQNPVRWASFL